MKQYSYTITATFEQVFGRRVSDRRKSLKLSQLEVAQRAGLARATLVYIESGKTSATLWTAFQIAEALGVPLSDLLPEAS